MFRLPTQADAISSIVKAAGIEVEPYWPALFAKLFAKKDMGDLITNVGAGACWLGRLRGLWGGAAAAAARRSAWWSWCARTGIALPHSTASLQITNKHTILIHTIPTHPLTNQRWWRPRCRCPRRRWCCRRRWCRQG